LAWAKSSLNKVCTSSASDAALGAGAGLRIPISLTSAIVARWNAMGSIIGAEAGADAMARWALVRSRSMPSRIASSGSGAGGSAAL
jgi:hypothetical protein